MNLINGKNNNAQIRANMKVVHNLLGDDTQEEANYAFRQNALCAA